VNDCTRALLLSALLAVSLLAACRHRIAPAPSSLLSGRGPQFYWEQLPGDWRVLLIQAGATAAQRQQALASACGVSACSVEALGDVAVYRVELLK